MYNPLEVRVSTILITNRPNTIGHITNYVLYGSNDNLNYHKLTEGVNTVLTSGATWTLNVGSTGFYKYHKIIYDSTGNGQAGAAIVELLMQGTYRVGSEVYPEGYTTRYIIKY